MTEEDMKFSDAIANCETFADWYKLVLGSEETTGHERAFELITNEHEAFKLAWHLQCLVEDEFVTRALAKLFELVESPDNEDGYKSLREIVYDGFSHTLFFYDWVFSDATLVKKLAELNGLDMT